MNFRLRKIAIILPLFIALNLSAQKTATKQNLVWYAYFITLKFNSKWYLQTELQERHFINPLAQHQYLVRTHLHRQLGKSGWETAAGFCVFMQNPNNPEAAVKLTVPELRPHIEFSYKQKLKHLNIDHRYKVEARFFHNINSTATELEEGYQFGNFRFRYRLQATVPVWKIDDSRALKIKVGDEIHINAGKKIVKNVFDQNRVYAGLSIDILPTLTFDAGYLNWYQQRPSGDFFNRHIIRFAVNHTINLQKNKQQTK